MVEECGSANWSSNHEILETGIKKGPSRMMEMQVVRKTEELFVWIGNYGLFAMLAFKSERKRSRATRFENPFNKVLHLIV